ncbi:MAG: DUF5050 domain-containing protein [Lachnospiraceae bacterium]|nr:DUF5050 domain-containing protein [Lachnospiraceae bacterium]
MKKTKILSIAIPVILIIGIASGLLIYHLNRQTKFPSNFNTGNSGGNLYNGGYFCERDGIVYFANPNDNLALYSTNRVGGELRKLSADKTAYINVDDHYVSYTRNNSDDHTSSFSFLNIETCALCRVNRSNGKNKKYLDGDPCLYATQVGEYIYYIHYDKKEASTLYRVRLDGSDKKQVAKAPIIAVASEGPSLYYAGVKEDHNLHRIDVRNEANITLINGNFFNPIVSDGYVYYMDPDEGYALSKMNLSTQQKVVLVKERVDCFNLTGSYLYYQRNSSDPALCRIKTDGTEFEEIISGNYANINVTNSYVYFSKYQDLSTFYYMPTTGKPKVSVFNPEVISK